MRIVVRDGKTELYASSVGSWTPDLEEALVFASALHAIHFVLDNHLENMEILFSFGNPDLDVRVPLTPGALPPIDPRRGADDAR